MTSIDDLPERKVVSLNMAPRLVWADRVLMDRFPIRQGTVVTVVSDRLSTACCAFVADSEGDAALWERIRELDNIIRDSK